MTEKKYYLGKCDGYGNGQKSCEAYITWELKEGNVFSMQAEIWNVKKTDIIIGGQCVEEVVKFFPKDDKAKQMLDIWKKYHLNDMHSGTPKQEESLDEYFIIVGQKYDYHLAVAYLKSVNLYTDNGYTYGSGWLKEEIPQDVIEIIKSW